MSLRWPGGIIRKNPVTPTGPDYNGTASGIWTVQEAAYWTKQGLWPTPGVIVTPDPYFENVSLLMHGDGLGNANNNLFMDSSSAATVVNRNGNPAQGQFDPYSPYWSCYFDGSGDYLTYQNATTNGFGTGDFTIEGWVYCSELPGSNSYDIIDFRTAGNQLAPAIIIRPNANSNTVSLLVNGVFVINGPAFPFGQWNHIAVCRSGTSTRLFVNGVQGGSTYSDSNNYGGSSPPSIGAYAPSPSGTELKGYISNIRAVKGYALYTSNFTPPTTPLTVNAGGGVTGVLTCGYNRIFDAGASALTITISGNVSVSRFSPFQPGANFQSGTTYGQSFTSPWAMAVDGTGDYITTNASTALGAGTGDFTLECWVYYTTSPDNSYTLGLSNAANDYGVNLEVRSGYPAVHLYSGSHSDFVLGGFGEQFRNNQWNHWALSRISGVLYGYVNGSRLTNSTTFTTNMGTSGKATIGGPETNKQKGFISNVRYTIGVAAYSGPSYVVPSGPIPATRNTGLLTCQSPTFVDNSGNNLTINTFGDVAMLGDNMFQPGYSSVYFDGSGDYLTVPTNAAFEFGTGDFTIEGWLYYEPTGALQLFADWRPPTTDGVYPLLYIDTSGNVIYHVSGAARITSSSVAANTWNHFAVSRSGTSTRLFINGVQSGSTYSDSNNYLAGASRPVIGASGYNIGTLPFKGYLSNLRLVKGTAVYTGTFTPPTTPLTAVANTSLLTCQNNAFTDNSTNNFIVTPFGNTTVTGNSPFGPTGFWSLSGTTAQGATIPQTTATDLGSGSFTIECWVNVQTFGSFITKRRTDTALTGSWMLSADANGYFYFLGVGWASTYAATTNPIPLGKWTHIAVSRSGTNLSMFVDGVRVYNVTDSYDYTCSTYTIIKLGGNEGGNYPAGNALKYGFAGSISNLRIVQGTAVYNPASTSFTVPTAPLTAISGTSLLTCQNGTMKDNSTNNNTNIALYAGGAIQTFNPFSSRFLGADVGSIYFDGSGDWLSTSSTITLPSTANYTLDFWLYPFAAFSSNRALVETLGERWGLITEAGSIYFLSRSTEFDTNVNPIPGTWNHIALTRSSGTIRVFLNGTQIGTANGNTDSFTNLPIWIGNDTNSQVIPQSYMANVRFVVGTAVYTGNFAPPTTATPSIPGTVLNVNGTNAGVFDQTTINNIETVGDVKLSTAVKKYGTGSIYFDGTGDYLSVLNSPAMIIGVASFTLEFWWYPISITGFQSPFDKGYTSAGGLLLQTGAGDGKIVVYASGSAVITASTAVNVGDWNHIALVRDGTSMVLYLNGVSVGSATNSTNFNNTSTVGIGANATGGGGGGTYPINGYIDDFRFTNGIARYTTNFFPSPGPFQNY